MPSFLNRSLGLPPAIRRTLSAAELDQDSASRTGDFQEVWSSIKKGGEELGKIPVRHSSADVWGAILSEKAAKVEDENAYVHPLVKRSGSCLSEKSLEICTESLGSETGADGFSTEEKNEEVVIEDEEKPVCGVRLYGGRKVGNRSVSVFPPPLPSLGGGSGNVRMMSHRENGRLLLEAVSVPSRNCFRAEREGGRLLLTFDDVGDDCEEEEEEVVVVEKEMKVETAIVMKTGAMLNVDYKFLCLTRSSWSNRFNKVVNSCGGDNDKEKDENAYLIPSNKYVYSWRTLKPMLEDSEATSGLVVVEAVKGATVGVDYKFDELLPGLLRGCNKLKHSLLVWDTAKCIVSRS